MSSGPAKKGTLSSPTPNNSALTSHDAVLEHIAKYGKDFLSAVPGTH